MKKIILSCLLLFFLCQAVYAETNADKIESLNNEIRRLSNKLEVTSNPAHRKQINSLIAQYKARLAAVQEEEKKSGENYVKFIPKVGLVAGSAGIGLDLHWKNGPVILKPAIGYAINSSPSLTVLTAGLGIVFPFGQDNYFGVDAVFGSYSAKVKLTGSGDVGSGSTIGGALVYGRRITNNIVGEIGYGTNLGVLASLGYIL